MNSMKLIFLTISMVIISLMVGPGSDAHSLIHPHWVFKAAKLGTLGLLGKGAIVAPVAVALAAKAGVVGTAAVVGGAAGIKTGLLAATLKAPLFLAKGAFPNLIAFAPLLKGKKKHTVAVAEPIPVAPMLPPAPVYAPPVYAPPAYAPPAYAPPAIVRSGY